MKISGVRMREISLQWLGHFVRKEQSFVGKRVEAIVEGWSREIQVEEMETLYKG